MTTLIMKEFEDPQIDLWISSFSWFVFIVNTQAHFRDSCNSEVCET